MTSLQKSGPIPVDTAVRWLARLQHGVIARRQLLALGATDNMIQGRLSNGSLERRAQSVYVLASTPPSFEQAAVAVLIGAGKDAVLAGRWAAAWWGLLGSDGMRNARPPVDILMPSGARSAVVNANVTRVTVLQAEDAVPMTPHERDRILLEGSERRRLARGGNPFVRRGLYRPKPEAAPRSVAAVAFTPRVTTVARTVVDVARWAPDLDLSGKDVERLVNDALSQHLVSAKSLTACAARAVPPRAPGRGRVLRQLERVSGGYIPPDSELERVGLAAFERWGCPEPVRQMEVPGRPGQPGQVDFAWPQARVVIEVDGRGHLSEEQVDKDRARDRAALLAGWRPFRYGWTDFRELRARTRKEVRSIFGLT